MMKENEEVKNMEPDESPYLEEPETLNPTEKNKEDLENGGGGNDSKK